MSDDRGAAALAARLNGAGHGLVSAEQMPAILGEHGRFLPDGSEAWVIGLENEIEQLRAAVKELWGADGLRIVNERAALSPEPEP